MDDFRSFGLKSTDLIASEIGLILRFTLVVFTESARDGKVY